MSIEIEALMLFENLCNINAHKKKRAKRGAQFHKCKSEKKKRLCLGCGVGFMSEGAHNRLCKLCREIKW